jgi:branched-chain amino acid transport system ATP-binding protein
MLGLSIAELVARAERKSAASTSPRNGPSRPAAPAPRPSAPTLTPTPMPDLSASGADRLRAALAEIEQAARRAEAYRPGFGRKS